MKIKKESLSEVAARLQLELLKRWERFMIEKQMKKIANRENEKIKVIKKES